MLLSALHRTPQADFSVHYLHDPDFPAATQQQIRSALAKHAPRLTLHFHCIPDEWVEGLPLFGFMKPGLMRPVMWYRLFLPRLLPDATKVLYLDCDTLVLDSLLPLWETPLGKHALAAVTNPSWSSEQDVRWYAECGLASQEQYFNSGVMLLNLDEFRAQRWSEAVLAHGRANGHWTQYGDQDSLVILLHAHRLRLSPRWNVMRIVALSGSSRSLFTPQQMEEAIRSPAIIHFEGSTKPWVDATKHPWGRLHARYARQLPWPVKDEPWQLLDLENFFIRRHWPRARKRMLRLRQWLQRRRSG